MRQSVFVLASASACLFGILGVLGIVNLIAPIADGQPRSIRIIVAGGFTLALGVAYLSVCTASICAIPLERSKLPAFMALAIILVSFAISFGLIGIDYIENSARSGDVPVAMQSAFPPFKLRLWARFLNNVLIVSAVTLLCWPIIRDAGRGATRSMGLIALVLWLLGFAVGTMFWSYLLLTDSVPSVLRYSLVARGTLSCLAGIFLCIGVIMLSGQAKQDVIVTAEVVAPEP